MISAEYLVLGAEFPSTQDSALSTSFAPVFLFSRRKVQRKRCNGSDFEFGAAVRAANEFVKDRRALEFNRRAAFRTFCSVHGGR